MRNWFDRYTKSFLQDMLGPTGKVETQHEVTAADSQWADVWYEPTPALAHLRERMGWLGVMSAAACIFEPFGQLPGEEEVHECLRKLFTKQHQRIREAKKNKAPKPPLPRLWTIAPSLPSHIVETFALRQAMEWPQGIFFGPDGYGLAWVSLRDLPRTRQTLLLRLMGGMGPVFRTAVEDLENLPQQAWEKDAAKEMLVARHKELGHDPSGLGQEEQEFLMSTQELVQEWKEQIRNEARQELCESLRNGLLETYRARFGTMPLGIERTVQVVQDPDKLTKWVLVFSTKSPEEITDILSVISKGSS
jgi:hypothetical protein